jgi:hypothetical protein
VDLCHRISLGRLVGHLVHRTGSGGPSGIARE